MVNILHLIEPASLLLAAFIIGATLGYILRRFVFSPAPSNKTPAASGIVSGGTVNAKADDGRLITLDAPTGGAKDDLKKIKGVGPKIEGTLNDLGIFHFNQIADWNRQTVARVDEALSFKGRIDREKWVSQARTLASG